MLSSFFRHALRATPFLAAMTVIGGCNALLDNRPGEPQGDVSATSPGPESGSGDGAERDGGASGSSVPQPSTDDAASTDPGVGTGVACAAGLADCNADPSDGCETKLVDDRLNCGACGRVCASKCKAGTCVGKP